MSAALTGDKDQLAALAALADPATLSSLDSAVGYLDALGSAYPDVAAGDRFVAVRADAAALRDAVAGYQAAAAGSSAKSAALATVMELGPRLPDELGSLASVFRTRPDDVFLPRALAGDDAATARLLRTYLAADGHASQLSVITADEPYSSAAFATVRRVRAVMDGLVAGSATAAPASSLIERASVGGATATSADVQAAITDDFKLVGLITVLGVFVVLSLLLRSLVAPIYLVGTVLLSYATTMAIATFIFQGVLGYGGVNYLVPLIVFVLLVALGSDYNIFLMSRVREESAEGDLRTGITTATARTGTVITSAGIILAGTFLALTVAPLQILLQIGLTVAIGVLIDTFVVRSLLIPALTVLIGERAWWPSARRQANRRASGVPSAST